MGRVRTRTVKRSARVIIEKYYAKLTLDFQMNKKICEEVAVIPSKRLRNKIAGFTTHLRRMEYVPDKSEVDIERITVDPDTKDMLKELDMDNLTNIQTTQNAYGVVAGAGAKRF